MSSRETTRRLNHLNSVASSLRHFGLRDEFDLSGLVTGQSLPTATQFQTRLARYRELLPNSITPAFLAEFIAAELSRSDSAVSETQPKPRGSAKLEESDVSLNVADVRAFAEIPTGAADRQANATRYQYHVFRVLRGVFAQRVTVDKAPALTNARLEVARQQGRMRIDIQFRNTGSNGFFSQLVSRFGIKAPFIPVECKNYKADLSNNDFGQLSSRLNAKVGQFGIITCREIRNSSKIEVLARAYTQKGTSEYLLVLSDVHMIALVEARLRDDDQAIDDLLNERLEILLLH